MCILCALLVIVAVATPAEANHSRGHYGGVPSVQPAPLPWQPRPYQRPPVYAAPPPPAYVAPPPTIYVPVPQPEPPRPGRYKGLNVCETMRCD